jgi:hypothetical protein
MSRLRPLDIIVITAAVLAWAWLVATDKPAPDEEHTVKHAVAASQAADRHQCQDMHGPHALALQLPDGSHRCVDRNGRRLHTVITIPAHQLAHVRP